MDAFDCYKRIWKNMYMQKYREVGSMRKYKKALNNYLNLSADKKDKYDMRRINA